MTDAILKKGLWSPRPVAETMALYANWAETYDKEVLEAGYAMPHRVAAAVAQFAPQDAIVLDFGCGTGLSGMALQNQGLVHVDGMDISPEMLDIAHSRQIYREIWQAQPGEMTNVETGLYQVIVAMGVISLGAAPPETLSLCLSSLEADGLLALSFNDPTLEDGSYDAALNATIEAGVVEVLFREHGPHLQSKNLGSDVIVLKKL
ncbi:MAG: methyltransferase domain-containing protein [Pseudomonadota bacterium]